MVLDERVRRAHIQQRPCGARKRLKKSRPLSGEDIGAGAIARTPRVGLHVIVLLLGALAIARADDFPSRYIKVIVGPGLKGQ